MKKISLLFLMFSSLVGFCSTNDSIPSVKDSTKTKKIKYGISFSSDYCFRKLKPNDDSKWIADIRDSLEIAKFGYTVGVNVDYALNEKISVESGILFSDAGSRTKKQSLESLPSGQKPTNYSFNFHYYYLNIPLKVNYCLIKKKLKLYVDAGLSANILVKEKTTSITSFGNSDSRVNTKTDSGLSKLNVLVLAGFGVQYPIGKKTNLIIEPVYRRSINSIIKAPIKEYLYSFGINIGVRF